MLELPIFGHMDKMLLVTLWKEIMMSQLLLQNTFVLRRPRVANFAFIINIAAMFTNTTFKN